MKIKSPYNDLDLGIASISMRNKIESYIQENGEDTLKEKIEKIANSIIPKNLSESIANYHGITVDQLLSSPNYIQLKFIHDTDLAQKTIQLFKKEFLLDDKEAWALLCSQA